MMKISIIFYFKMNPYFPKSKSGSEWPPWLIQSKNWPGGQWTRHLMYHYDIKNGYNFYVDIVYTLMTFIHNPAYIEI